jgi:predicted metalloendopeptidase
MRRHALLLTLVACSGRSSHLAPAVPPAAQPMTIAQSGIVADWLDRAADPCQDFFQYACGGFLETAVIPPDRSSWSAIQVVMKDIELFLRDVLERAATEPGNKLGDFYAACMDEAAIDKAGAAPLAPVLDVIAQVKDAKSAARAVIQLHDMGVFPFFALGATQDFADATEVIAALDQSGLGLPDRDYYLKNDGNLPKLRESYRAHVGRMFALLGVKPDEQRAAINDVLRVETGLARLQQDQVARRDPHVIYHRIDRSGLVKVAPSFPWDAYFEKLGIAQVTAVTVNDPQYYTAVAQLVLKEKPAALRRYLTWTLLDAVAGDLSRPFVEENFALAKLLTGVKELPPRWRRCVQQTDQDLGELLGQSYVAARFAGESKPRAVDLTKAVLAAMDGELDRLPWMDAPTRAAAKEKVGRMAYLVGYPDKWRRYDFAVNRGQFTDNVWAAERFERARQLAKIGKPVDRFDWHMTPPTVNAYYDSSLNELVLPAGQLQPPFFGATFHPAVNFGSTGGGTIGHEMTHGFDDEGRQFDADGNLRDWWSKPTSEKFDEAAQCVVDQYAKYEAVPGITLNGKLTAGENIADIGGVKLGFVAYQGWKTRQSPPPPAQVEGFTDEQLYFLAYGQSWCSKDTTERLETMARSNPHSPPRWRANGVVVNLPAFAAAFQCKAGAAMNPGKVCEVW